MNDEEDVKKIMEVLKCSKEEATQEFEYEEFINCDSSDVDENEGIINDGEDDYLFCDLANTDISKLNTYDLKSSLKPEERIVIDSCDDQNLKNILLLNRTKNIQLIQLYKKMKDLLIECQKNITDKNSIIKAHSEANKGQTNSTGAWRLAAPYFKDIQLYCSPLNDDTLLKKSNKELSIYDLYPFLKWSRFECEKLMRAVKLNYNINQQNMVRKEIEEISKSHEKDAKSKLEELEARMRDLDTDDITEIPPQDSDHCIDWLRVADVFLKDKRSASECKSMWHIYLHPHINKTKWTTSENTKLKELVKKHKYQNWDQIAKDLGTNRTGFTVCRHYYSKLHDTYKRGDFTYEEDARLLDLVYQHRMGSYIPWFKIVQHFKDRSRAQLHHRYTYYLSQNNKKRGKFSDAEDILLMIIVNKFGKNYKKCCEYLPNRSMVQIKSRYNSNLQYYIKKGSFTVEEDKIIMQYVEEHGSRSWASLTEKLNRSRGQIRQRYHTIRQFLDSNPELTVVSVPRRKHYVKSEEFDVLRVIADQYRDSPTIPSLEEIKKILRNKKKEEDTFDLVFEEDSEEDEQLEINTLEQKLSSPLVSLNIDDMLTNFFCNSFKICPQKYTSSTKLTKAARDMTTILRILEVNLDIPCNLDEDVRLDSLDVAILNKLIEENPKKTGKLIFKTNDNDITTLVPPNLYSLVGLRSLLIKFSHYKSEESQGIFKLGCDNTKRHHVVTNVRSDMNRILTLPAVIRREVENDCKLFYKRFYALFKWPTVLTFECPNAELISISLQNIIAPKMHAELSEVKRTYSRANRNVKSESESKRVKLLPIDSSSGSPAQALPIKLTPVTNKSVIEDLLRNKNKKLFCFDKLKCGDVTKTIIREVPLSAIETKLITNRSSTATKKCTIVNVSHSPATTSNPPACEATSSSQKSQVDIGESECVITDMDDGESISTYGGHDSMVDDEEDHKNMDIFFSEECEEPQSEEHNDLQDLKKLDMFLKKEIETGGGSSDESSLFE